MSPLYIGGKQEIVFRNCIPEIVGIELTGFQRNTDDSVLSRFLSITQYDSYTVLHSIMMTHDMNISWLNSFKRNFKNIRSLQYPLSQVLMIFLKFK